MNQKKIGKFIQERRKLKELTQVELAEKLGVSNRTISKWENGVCLPDYSLFDELCRELDISINELLSGEVLTKDNYQEKLEKNFVDTIDYNNKMRSKRLKKFIFIVIGLLIVYLAYKLFIIFYFEHRFVSQEEDNSFPYNKEIYSLNITNNGLANEKINSNMVSFYVPENFLLITDKAKSGLVVDDCNLYTKNLKVKDDFDSAILICTRPYDNLGNLDYYGINSTLFPYLDIYKVLEKYEIEDTIDLIKYHEKHYDDKHILFTSSSKIKMDYIAEQFSSFSLPSYNRFFYLENDLRGYLIESKNKLHYQAIFMFRDDVYSISFFNRNDNYFDYDKVLEVISSISSL